MSSMMKSISSSRAPTCFAPKVSADTRVLGVRRSIAAPVNAVEHNATRRESFGVALASLTVASSVVSGLAASPALAFLGFDDTDSIIATYTADTKRILALTNDTLALARDDPARTGKVQDLRKEINYWVASYRRQDKVAGRPSFGNTYSAVNALAGHFNSFGLEAPIPKKRLERLTKEVTDAGTYLNRGR